MSAAACCAALQAGPALFHCLLRRGDSGLVRGDSLNLRGSGGFVLIKVRARNYLVVVESLVTGEIGLVLIINRLRLLQFGEGALEVTLRGSE